MLGAYAGMMALLACLSVPIAFVLVAGSAGYLLHSGSLDLIVIAHKIQESIDSFSLLAVPFFVLAGAMMDRCNITAHFVELASSIVGPIRGSLGHVNVTTSMLLSGVSGSGAADAAAVGSVLIPAMKEDGYPPGFAAALTSAAGSMGPIIPPSILMVIYGSMAEVSVGRLFLGGAIPGLLMGLSLMAVIYFISRSRNYGSVQKTSAKRFAKALWHGLPALSIPVIIVVGIVGGIFTPTEASIAAVLATMGAGAIYNAMSVKVLRDSLRETLALLGPVMLVVAASGMFGYILTSEQAGESLARFLGSISESRTVVLLLIVGLLLLLGCVMEVLSVLILLTPLLIPIILHLGVDPVYFGVLMVFTLSIGLITPPVGLCMFVSCSIAKVSMEGYTRELIPFLAVLVAVNLLIVFFPEFVMYVPNLLMPAK